MRQPSRPVMCGSSRTTSRSVPEGGITVQPWRSLALRNTPGTLSPQIPLFLAQGTADTIVRPEVTRGYMQRQCKAGGKVAMMWVPGVNAIMCMIKVYPLMVRAKQMRGIQTPAKANWMYLVIPPFAFASDLNDLAGP